MNTLTLLPIGNYDVFVSKVHDGDSYHALVPVDVPIRSDGIQAAELKTDKGKLVAAWLKDRIEGKWCQLSLRAGYKYGANGERMGVVSIDGVDVCQEMIDKGLAVAWTGRGPRPVGAIQIEETDMAWTPDEEAAIRKLLANPPTPAIPTDWGKLIDKWLVRLTPVFLAVLAYFGINIQKDANNASAHAQTANAQVQEDHKAITGNTAEIAVVAQHAELAHETAKVNAQEIKKVDATLKAGIEAGRKQAEKDE